MGLVIITFPLLPRVMDPTSSDNSRAAAALMVIALNACSGVIRNLMQAKLQTKDILAFGVEPGLKSVANATGRF